MSGLRRAAALFCACALAACGAQQEQASWRAIGVTSERAELGAGHVGALRFLGGLALQSEAAAFGGLSDISISPDGAFLAITDTGFFVRGRLALSADGAPLSIADVEIARMRDENGAPLSGKETADSEGLAIMPDGRVAVSFEGTQVVRFYDLAAGFDAAPGPALAGAARLPANGGLEALASFANGDLLAGAEDAGLLWIAAQGASEAGEPAARYPLETGYGLVDLDRLPDGDFVALERFYAPVVGNRIRIARLAADSLHAAGGVARKEELAFFGAGLALDNFEGVSVAPGGDGKVRLYIVSDDNFSARQRTLIYAFELDGAP